MEIIKEDDFFSVQWRLQGGKWTGCQISRQKFVREDDVDVLPV